MKTKAQKSNLKTVEAAKADAFARAAASAKPMDPSAVVVISACP